MPLLYRSLAVTAIHVTSAAAATAAALRFDHDIDWFSANTSLPKVVMYNVGGTILATSKYSALDNVHYGNEISPTLPDFLNNVTEVFNVAQLGIIDMPDEGGSSALNSSMFLNITQHANRHLCSPDSDIVGAIMNHGTNTMEETAFGVDITLNCSKPFVAYGAMRPDSYISPDGRSNLFQAVSAAAARSSRDRGGLIAFNDRITSIFYSTKTNANHPDTFKALEQGNLGTFLGGMPYYFYGPSLPVGRPHFEAAEIQGELPSVAILYGHQGFDATLMHAAVANGAKGIVYMGAGPAQLSPEARSAAKILFQRGVPTVSVTRSVTGTGVPEPMPWPVIYGAYVSGVQARIILQLCLASGYDLEQIRALFEDEIRMALYGSWASQQWYYDAARQE